MNKYYISGLVISVLAFPIVTYAVGQDQGTQQGVENENTQPTKKTIVTSTGVANQNRVETENRGEENEIKTQEQEMEQEGSEEETSEGQYGQNRNQNANEHMSNVAEQVQQLLQVRTTGGIGDQVRQIAQEQTQTQTQIQEQLNKLDSKGKLARLISGTDYGAVKNLKAQLEQNRVRIQQLEKLQNQLSNQGDLQMIQETIKALTAENTALQERVALEEQTKSLLGWLFRFFEK